MGYPQELLTDPKINEEFVCSICHDILQAPTVLDPCEHWFCKSCADEWYAKSKTCPLDKLAITGFKTPQRAATNLLNSLQLRCPFKRLGCTTVMKLDELDKHADGCEFGRQRCQNNLPWSCGAGAMLTKGEMKNHSCAPASNMEKVRKIGTKKHEELVFMEDLKDDIAQRIRQHLQVVEPIQLVRLVDGGDARGTMQQASVSSSARFKTTMPYRLPSTSKSAGSSSCSGSTVRGNGSTDVGVSATRATSHGLTISPVSAFTRSQITCVKRENISEPLYEEILDIVTKTVKLNYPSKPTDIAKFQNEIMKSIGELVPMPWRIKWNMETGFKSGGVLKIFGSQPPSAIIDLIVLDLKLAIWR